jgi:hypothetical protein
LARRAGNSRRRGLRNLTGKFRLADILPWGWTRAEYTAFFDLAALDPECRLLDCAGGPASFNAEMTEAGFSVVSADPLYRFSAKAIAGRVDETRARMEAGLRANRHRFVLNGPDPIRRHLQTRETATSRFLADFAAGCRAGRYRVAALPRLPFAAGAFDLALCSHFLFLYSGHLDTATHIAAIAAMLDAAPEARIFPLLDLDGEPSRHVDPVRAALEARGHGAAIERVDYEFQKGGHAMLRVWR